MYCNFIIMIVVVRVVVRVEIIKSKRKRIYSGISNTNIIRSVITESLFIYRLFSCRKRKKFNIGNR